MLVEFEATLFGLADTLVRMRQAFPRSGPKEIDAVYRFLLDVHNRMPSYLQLAFRILTMIFDGWTYFTDGKPFRRLDPARRIAIVNVWRRSRLEPRRRFIEFYASLAVFGLYSELYGCDYEYGVLDNEPLGHA